jgi:DNA-binding Lrp family transcriptional regulator
MSLKERLARYLRNNHGWIASGDLQRIVAEKTSYSPQNVGRRLRELENDGVLEVQIRKGHAHYRIAQKEPALF